VWVRLVGGGLGPQITGLGQLAKLTGPASVPLPSRIFDIHVVQVRNLTRSLGEAYRANGSNPQVSSTAAKQATRLLRARSRAGQTGIAGGGG
jgi:hypothetical protein